MTPIPGTKTFDDFGGYKDYSELTFSPTWRDDYTELCRFRDYIYRKFLILKIIFHPIKVLKQLINLLRKSFDTKSEMNIYRLMIIRKMLNRSGQ
jgi:hypothetical protein